MLTKTRARLAHPVATATTRVARDVHLFRIRLGRARFALSNVGLLAVATVMFSQFVAGEMQLVMDTHTENLIGIGVSAMIVAITAYRWARVLPTQAPDEPGSYGTAATSKLSARRGLVLVLGLDSASPSSPAAELLSSLPNLEYLALIGTRETDETNVATLLCDKIAPACGVDLPRARIRSWQFGDAESIADSEEATAEALRWLLGRGLDASEIIVDVSAGRRAMGYGAKDAADEVSVETQYLASAWETTTNKPIPGTAMFKVIKAYHP